MTVLIIHGIGGHAGIHWQQWLKAALEQNGHKVLMPDMPDSGHPDRTQWLNKISKLLTNEDLSDLVIIGHSLGVTTALDFIEQAKQPITGLVSVSGFASDYGAELNSYFLKGKSLDFDKIRDNIKKSIVIYGHDDPYVTQEALREVADQLNAHPILVANGGHLNTESGFTEFPQLLQSINDMVAAT